MHRFEWHAVVVVGKHPRGYVDRRMQVPFLLNMTVPPRHEDQFGVMCVVFISHLSVVLEPLEVC